ncbi:unnamed protein product [Lampetra planeri]
MALVTWCVSATHLAWAEPEGLAAVTSPCTMPALLHWRRPLDPFGVYDCSPGHDKSPRPSEMRISTGHHESALRLGDLPQFPVMEKTADNVLDRNMRPREKWNHPVERGGIGPCDTRRQLMPLPSPRCGAEFRFKHRQSDPEDSSSPGTRTSTVPTSSGRSQRKRFE